MTIAKDWKEVTIEMYQELTTIQRDNDISTIIERIAVLADTDPESVRQLPIPQFRELTKQIEWVMDKPQPDMNYRFELDGKRYGIIPDLNFISTGEWADIENWKDKSIENLHFICALIYRPITKESDDEWEIESHKPQGFMKRAELFRKKLTIDHVFGAVLFFSASGIQFIEIITDYLEDESKVVTKKKTSKKTTTRKATKKNN
jgi:hypothetical protein